MRDAVFIVLALVGWGSWTVIEKLALRHTTPMMVQLIGTYVYSALAPVVYLGMKSADVSFVWNAWGIFWVTLGSVVATVASYAFLIAIEHRPVHQVMSVTQLYPALSFLLCWACLGEKFTVQKVIGATIMVAGTAIMNW